MSSAVAFGLAEGAVRILFPELVMEDSRSILTTEPVHLGAAGEILYPPGRDVRSALVIGGRVEFDVHFHTNNLGFIDHRNYPLPPRSGRSFAFVGDSYTAGVEGGDPWVPALRDRLGLEIYNLGTGGAGVELFHRALTALARVRPPTDVVVLAISDDFIRSAWYPDLSGNELRICVDGEPLPSCRARGAIAYLIDPRLDEAGLLSAAAGFQRRWREARGLLRRSKLLVATKRYLRTALEKERDDGAVAQNLAALGRIRADFPGARLHFIQIPVKTETTRSHYQIDLEKRVKALGFEYHAVLGSCDWAVENYHRRDIHPNALGYRRLSECVAHLLGLA